MKPRLMGLSVGAAVAVVMTACYAEEPESQCVVARSVSDGSTGSFAATYTLKEGQNPDRICAQLQSEPVGLQKYYSQNPTGEERDPNLRDTVGIRSSRMGQLLKDYKARLGEGSIQEPSSVGELASDAPGEDNFCEVPNLSVSRLEVPASEDKAAQSYAYEWSNLRIYNTPEIPGTQFVADLRYTENGCTAEYQVKGIWPVVRCEKDGPLGTDGKPTKVPNEVACEPYPDFEAGRLRGSGINPIFPVKCDPVARICVLTGDVPSDKNP